MIDSHCHLTDERLANIAPMIERAKAAGVEGIIIPTTSVLDLVRAVEIAKREEKLWILAGIHPENIEPIEDVDKEIDQVRRIIERARDKVVGIGEIGLDFYYDKEKRTRNKQEEVFKKMLMLAEELGLPVAIHSREAQEETKKIVEGMENTPKGQFHCFGGDAPFLAWVLERGFYVSYCGNLTFKNAENLRQRLKETPTERLLLETDSPYLAPEPIRGSVNEPKNVKIIAEYIAQITNRLIDDVAWTTTQNTLCLYSLPGY